MPCHARVERARLTGEAALSPTSAFHPLRHGRKTHSGHYGSESVDIEVATDNDLPLITRHLFEQRRCGRSLGIHAGSERE